MWRYPAFVPGKNESRNLLGITCMTIIQVALVTKMLQVYAVDTNIATINIIVACLVIIMTLSCYNCCTTCHL